MKFIQTVLSKIPADLIGITDGHEHLMRIGGVEVINGGEDFLMDNLEAAEKEIYLFKNLGGKTIVEMTPCGSGRDISSLVKLSKSTEINIIATTGFHKSELYDSTHFIYKYSAEEIANLLIADLEKGIDIYDYCGPIINRSNSKAGVIKAALSYQTITKIEEKVLEASAIASRNTGFPISLHTERGTIAIEAADILISHNVLPSNLIFCHIDRNPDFYYHKKLAEKGVYLLYDGPGRTKYYTDEVIVKLINEMLKEGYESQILLGGDLGRRSYFKSYNGGPGLDYNLGIFLPRLRDENLSEKVIQKLFIENAKAAFSNKAYEI